MNKKARIMTVAILLALIVSATPKGVTAEAAQGRGAVINEVEYNNGIRNVKEKSLSTVYNKNINSYERFEVSINGGKLTVSGFRMNKVDYIPYRAAAGALGISYSYNSSSRSSMMYGGGLVMSATEGCYSVYANDRPLFASSPVVIMSDGRMYIPLASFAKATGLEVEQRGPGINLKGSYKPLASSAKFYRDDEVLWLARIIHAESSGESLLGKIAVGNVVLNRVKSPLYPNTIYSVIFDRKYGVQFSPIIYGTIYNTPSYESTLAAKICLEGFDISEGALFFLHPEISTSSWIPANRSYLFSVGSHDFYG